MQHNLHEHGEQTEALFYLLNQGCRTYYESSDAAIAAYTSGDILMVRLPEDNDHIRAGRAT